jgi:hypothetical protein
MELLILLVLLFILLWCPFYQFVSSLSIYLIFYFLKLNRKILMYEPNLFTVFMFFTIIFYEILTIYIKIICISLSNKFTVVNNFFTFSNKINNYYINKRNSIITYFTSFFKKPEMKKITNKENSIEFLRNLK